MRSIGVGNSMYVFISFIFDVLLQCCFSLPITTLFQIVGYGTTESALVFTPKCDILTIENRAGPNPEDLHVDDWSSDEGF